MGFGKLSGVHEPPGLVRFFYGGKKEEMFGLSIKLGRMDQTICSIRARLIRLSVGVTGIAQSFR